MPSVLTRSGGTWHGASLVSGGSGSIGIIPNSRVAIKLPGCRIFHVLPDQLRLNAMLRSGSHNVDSQRNKATAIHKNSAKADINDSD